MTILNERKRRNDKRHQLLIQLKGVNLVLGERVDMTTDDLKDEIKSSSQYYINGNRTVTTDKGKLLLFFPLYCNLLTSFFQELKSKPILSSYAREQ